MLYFALMAASMGLQQLKTWQDNKQKEALCKKQNEMRKAMQLREFDRARRLQAEAAKIAMEMEAEAHAQRRRDIETEYDNVFNSLIDQFQLDKWPLSVVPFIMKGESFGSHVRGFDVASIHCIFTPSNDLNFNRFVYSSLDLRIEQMMNTYWNSNATHQVVYYGGSWKPKAPNGVSTLDYSDVDKLHAELKSVPVICITPYFLPTGKMIFRVWAWGMGADATARQDITPFAEDFSIPLNSSSFIKPKDEAAEQEFSLSIDTFVVEVTNYLASMIGYISDMYYWKMYDLPPMCLSLNTNIFPYNHWKTYLLDDYCSILYDIAKDSSNAPKIDKILSYYSKIEPHMDAMHSSEFIDKAYTIMLDSKGICQDNISDISLILDDQEISALEKISTISDKYKFLTAIIEDAKNQIACNTVSAESDVTILDLLVEGYELLNKFDNSSKIQFNIADNGTFIALLNQDNEPINNRETPQCMYIEYKKLKPLDRIRIQSKSFILSEQQLKDILTKFSVI